MNGLKLSGLLSWLLLAASGLFFTGTSIADQVVHTEQTFRWGDGFVRVSYTHPNESGDVETAGKRQIVLVVDKTFWVQAPVELNRHGVNYFPEFHHSRVRIRVPVRYYLSSWDVKALERELERLGVKVKPKPAPPKPALTISG